MLYFFEQVEINPFDLKDIFKKVIVNQLALNSDNGKTAKRLLDSGKEAIRSNSRLTYNEWIDWIESALDRDKFQDTSINEDDPKKRTWGEILLSDNLKKKEAYKAFKMADIIQGEIESFGLDTNKPYAIQFEYLNESNFDYNEKNYPFFKYLPENMANDE